MVSTMPLHFPGHNYCGLGTWDFTQVAVGEVDECCKKHDEKYGDDDITTELADAELIECLQNTESTSGTLIAAVIKGKTYLDKLTGYASDSMLRRTEKRKQESIQAAEKRAKTIANEANTHDDNSSHMPPPPEMETGEPAVGPSGIISGGVVPGDTKANHGDIAGIRTLHFNRTMQH